MATIAEFLQTTYNSEHFFRPKLQSEKLVWWVELAMLGPTFLLPIKIANPLFDWGVGLVVWLSSLLPGGNSEYQVPR